MAKIGRNSQCPCGSGKKYKRCHGAPERRVHVTPALAQAFEKQKLEFVQRERQQGRGKPIISTKVAGHRAVAVNNQIYLSKTWRTFHDFLVDYMKEAMGKDWGNVELAKPLLDRHPVLLWYDFLCKHQEQHSQKPGEVYSAPLTGAVAAYMQLAYDLYLLAHNVELQQKLVSRLRDKENFHGARYEIFVAARLIQAGFNLELEDEDDRSTTHCEYIATFVRTGRVFSVEAKQRASSSSKFKLGRLLVRALRKRARGERIVFIDINVPDESTGRETPAYLERAINNLKSFEGKTIAGALLPEAYLVVTNTPGHHHPEKIGVRSMGLVDGFQKPDFKRGPVAYPSLHDAIQAREKHIEMNELFQSMNDHAEIPSTFDGQIPEYAFGEGGQRLIIGQRYMVRRGSGAEQEGLLTTATVLEQESRAYGGLLFDDGTSEIHFWNLSETEMIAWRKYPDTFFGQLQQRQVTVENPLQLYDFILTSYRNTTRDRLLQLLAAAPDIDKLKQLSQPDLANLYAERTAETILANHRGLGLNRS